MAELLQEERLEKGSEGTCDLKPETLYPGIKRVREMYKLSSWNTKYNFECVALMQSRFGFP